MLKTISSLLFREFPVATSATSHAGRSTVASELECEQPKTPDTTVDMMDAPPIMGLTSGKRVKEIKASLAQRYQVPPEKEHSVGDAVWALKNLDLQLSATALNKNLFDRARKLNQQDAAEIAVTKLDDTISRLKDTHRLIPLVTRSRDCLVKVLNSLQYADLAIPASIAGIGWSIVPHCKIAADLLLNSAVGDAAAGTAEAREKHLRRVEIQEYLADKVVELTPEQWKNSSYHNALRKLSWAGITKTEAVELELIGFSNDDGDADHHELNKDTAQISGPRSSQSLQWATAWTAPADTLKALQKATRARSTEVIVSASKGIAQQFALGAIAVAVANACRTGAKVTCNGSGWGWGSVVPLALASLGTVLEAAYSIEAPTLLANMLESGKVVTVASVAVSPGKSVRDIIADADRLPAYAAAAQHLGVYIERARTVGFSAAVTPNAAKIREEARDINQAALAKTTKVTNKILSLAGAVGGVGWAWATSTSACNKGVQIACHWSGVSYGAAAVGLLVGLLELSKEATDRDFAEKLDKARGNDLIKLANEMNATRPSGVRGLLIALNYGTFKVTSTHLANWHR